MSEARDEILNSLKNAVHPEPQPPDFSTPVYHAVEKPLEQAFKVSLEQVNGSVYLCHSEQELVERLKPLLSRFNPTNIVVKDKELQQLLAGFGFNTTEGADLPDSVEAAITNCEFLIAQTGSVLMSSALPGGRKLFVYPPVHFVIARKTQILDYLETAYKRIQEKYGDKLPSQITLISGPSRTADIEKTLVMGAHGPRELHVLIY